ncbi:sugar transferase [Aerococcus urinaeequi]|uniref:sugar transferase n=1 Tax=Aerococcus urinaeequi TaxID=51665 RepID=UPI003B47FC25
MKTLYSRYIKRLIDFVISVVGLLILSPILIVISIMIAVKLGKPVLFTQDRIGKNGKIFKLYKFRSMSNEVDLDGNLLPDNLRLTSFGKFLRSTSIDELPELWNIIIGDMSLVGPRPLVTQYLPYFTKDEAKRHDVRPGLTGFAQINGRNSLSWEERFAYDVTYVEKISFSLDLRIILKTFFKVFKRSDIGERGVGVLEDFDTYRKQQLRKED